MASGVVETARPTDQRSLVAIEAERENSEMAKYTWASALRSYLAKVRVEAPVPARDTLSLADEMRLRILGGHLMSWLKDWGPQLILERNALPMTRGDTREPLIVFLTDTPGLVAATEILGDHKRVVYCRKTEYEAFALRDEDHDFRVHCELHSYFDESLMDDDRWKDLARRAHPLKSGEDFWLHHDESVLGPLFARGDDHLWVWNGIEPRLLEEGWEGWVS